LAGPLATRIRSGWRQITASVEVLTHFDYWSGKVVWRDGKLTGIVDRSDGARGHAAPTWAGADRVHLFDEHIADVFWRPTSMGSVTRLPTWLSGMAGPLRARTMPSEPGRRTTGLWGEPTSTVRSSGDAVPNPHDGCWNKRRQPARKGAPAIRVLSRSRKRDRSRGVDPMAAQLTPPLFSQVHHSSTSSAADRSRRLSERSIIERDSRARVLALRALTGDRATGQLHLGLFSQPCSPASSSKAQRVGCDGQDEQIGAAARSCELFSLEAADHFELLLADRAGADLAAVVGDELREAGGDDDGRCEAGEASRKDREGGRGECRDGP